MMKETLTRICRLLNKHEVDYLLIGGVAVVYHGYTRSTADLDFWYNLTFPAGRPFFLIINDLNYGKPFYRTWQQEPGTRQPAT